MLYTVDSSSEYNSNELHDTSNMNRAFVQKAKSSTAFLVEMSTEEAKLYSDVCEAKENTLIGQGTFGKVYLIYNEDQVLKSAKYESEMGQRKCRCLNFNRHCTYCLQLYNEHIVTMCFQSIIDEFYILKTLHDITSCDYVMATTGSLLYHKESLMCGYLIPLMTGSLAIDTYNNTGCFYRTDLYERWFGNHNLHSIDQQINAIIHITSQLLIGMNHIHSLGIVHFDLKLENILYKVTNEFPFISIKIADFGIAKIVPNNNDIVCYSSHFEVATPNYRPPEVFYEMGGYGFAVDMWSIGVILLRLVEYVLIYAEEIQNVEQNSKIQQRPSKFPMLWLIQPLRLMKEIKDYKLKNAINKDFIEQDYTCAKIEIQRKLFDCFYEIGIYANDLYVLPIKNSNGYEKRQPNWQWWKESFKGKSEKREKTKFQYYEKHFEKTSTYRNSCTTTLSIWDETGELLKKMKTKDDKIKQKNRLILKSLLSKTCLNDNVQKVGNVRLHNNTCSCLNRTIRTFSEFATYNDLVQEVYGSNECYTKNQFKLKTIQTKLFDYPRREQYMKYYFFIVSFLDSNVETRLSITEACHLFNNLFLNQTE